MKGEDRNHAEVFGTEIIIIRIISPADEGKGQKSLDSAKRLSTYEMKEMSEELI